MRKQVTDFSILHKPRIINILMLFCYCCMKQMWLQIVSWSVLVESARGAIFMIWLVRIGKKCLFARRIGSIPIRTVWACLIISTPNILSVGQCGDLRLSWRHVMEKTASNLEQSEGKYVMMTNTPQWHEYLLQICTIWSDTTGNNPRGSEFE